MSNKTEKPMKEITDLMPSNSRRNAELIPFAVGYDDELIGIYYAENQEKAIQDCKNEMSANNFEPDTPAKDRLRGLIAIDQRSKANEDVDCDNSQGM